MSLTQLLAKIKPSLWRGFFLALVIILVATLSFGVGRLTQKGDREAIKIEYDPELTVFREKSQTQTATVLDSVNKMGNVVASSKGEKYHYLHCPGAKQISEANKIFFNSREEAEASGYTLAANCKVR